MVLIWGSGTYKAQTGIIQTLSANNFFLVNRLKRTIQQHQGNPNDAPKKAAYGASEKRKTVHGRCWHAENIRC